MATLTITYSSTQNSTPPNRPCLTAWIKPYSLSTHLLPPPASTANRQPPPLEVRGWVEDGHVHDRNLRSAAPTPTTGEEAMVSRPRRPARAHPPLREEEAQKKESKE